MSKSPFYTRDNRPKTTSAPTGDGYEYEYNIKLEENGHKTLTKGKKTHAYAMIQTFAEDCKIENILQRSIYDPSILEQKIAMYDDFTDSPKTLFEAQNMIIEMQNIWNSLPAAERETYNGEFTQFISQTGSEKWLRTMGMWPEDIPTNNVEPTSTPEQKGDEE